MRSLLCEHLRSEPFPNIDGEFIDCGESGNQGDARSGAQGSEIKLFPYALIWNRSYRSEMRAGCSTGRYDLNPQRRIRPVANLSAVKKVSGSGCATNVPDLAFERR
jgi:hypothetical protein